MEKLEFADDGVITASEMKEVSAEVNKIFKELNTDIVITKHFFDRVNHSRNKKAISEVELIDIFQSLFDRVGKKLSKTGGGNELKKLITSISSNINIPVAVEYVPETKKVKISLLTVMRTKKFHSKDPQVKVESLASKLISKYEGLFGIEENEKHNLFMDYLELYWDDMNNRIILKTSLSNFDSAKIRKEAYRVISSQKKSIKGGRTNPKWANAGNSSAAVEQMWKEIREMSIDWVDYLGK